MMSEARAAVGVVEPRDAEELPSNSKAARLSSRTFSPKLVKIFRRESKSKNIGVVN